MRFTPKTEDQIQAESLFPDGEYDFQCIDAVDKVSQSGNEMIAVKLQVYSDDGRQTFVNDYLMEKMLYKLLRFCQWGNLAAKYEAGELTADDCIGVSGRVLLKKEEQEGYKPKNAVKNYAKRGEGDEAKAKPARKSHEVVGPQDDIPF
jgi:hypothetical protein